MPDQPDAEGTRSVPDPVAFPAAPLRVFEVGKPFHPNMTSYPDGGSEFNYYDAGYELRMFLGKPSEREIETVQRGDVRFAVATIQGVIFLLYRFGAMPWCDSSYHIALLPEERRQVPEPEPTQNTRANLQVFLIDASDGILRAFRLVSLPPHVSRVLNSQIREQARTPFAGRAAHFALIDRIYRQYPTPKDMLPIALASGPGGGE